MMTIKCGNNAQWHECLDEYKKYAKQNPEAIGIAATFFFSLDPFSNTLYTQLHINVIVLYAQTGCSIHSDLCLILYNSKCIFILPTALFCKVQSLPQTVLVKTLHSTYNKRKWCWADDALLGWWWWVLDPSKLLNIYTSSLWCF